MMAAFSGPWASHQSQLIPFFHLFFSSQRSKMAIECLLSNFFNRRVHFESMEGEWIIPPTSELSYLGKKFSSLGQDFVIGKKSFNPTKGIKVSFFCDSFNELSQFFPQSSLSQFIHKTLCYLMKKPINIFLKIHFKKNTLQPCMLGSTHRLQWNSFLKTAHHPIVEFKL
jgi:predicted component of type VI protein secretion system